MTVALVVSNPAPLPGFKNTLEDEVHSINSYPQSTMAANTIGMFSFSQTEPSTDLLSGSSWATTAEGPQNFQDFSSDNGSAHSGEAEEYIFTSGQNTPRGSRLERAHAQSGPETQNTWNFARTTALITQGGQAMSRVNSSKSSVSSLSRTSQMSPVDMTGNATFRTGSPASSLAEIDTCLLLGADADTLTSQMCWPGYTLDMSLQGDAAPFPMADPNTLHMDPSQLHLGNEASLGETSPGSWDCFSNSISRSCSPATLNDPWLLAQSPNSSPELQCQSPSVDRKIPLVSDDVTPSVLSQLKEPLDLPPPFTSPRQKHDGESARDHELYKNAAPHEDGLYHCPWEGQATCNHKPEKLKCNYDKFVDSHLKPYRCKVESCDGARFSSTACLLRHEREAHGLHGHGDKPFLCTYEGCDRSQPGHGFPRQWNLRDHMKRVHNDAGNVGGSPPSGAAQPTKGRKRKTEGSESQTAPSRKMTVKSMAQSETREMTTQPLLEQWMAHRKTVESLIQTLGHPEDIQTPHQILEMKKSMEAMLQVTVDLRVTSKTEDLAVNSFVGTG